MVVRFGGGMMVRCVVMALCLYDFLFRWTRLDRAFPHSWIGSRAGAKMPMPSEGKDDGAGVNQLSMEFKQISEAWIGVQTGKVQVNSCS